MICPKCGSENPDGAVFCGQCATPLGAAATTPPPSMSYAPKEGLPQKKGIPWWGWLLIVCFVLCGCGIPVLAAILFPVFSQARDAARKTIALSNGKQIATTTAIYCTDFDDKYPPFSDSSDAANKLAPYFPNTKPASSDTAASPDFVALASSYQWNPELSGRSSVEVADGKVWLFFDPAAYRERHVVGHADFSADMETGAEFESIKAIKPFAKTK